MKHVFHKILVAVSGSDASIHAAKYAIIMAKNFHCKLVAVYVVDTATLKHLTLSKILIQEESIQFEENLKENGERYLSYVEELAQAKGVKIEKEIRKGAIYTEVLAAADEKKADLIVLGGWEKDRNPKDIFSQAPKEIMINSKCSVIYVKEPDIDNLYKHA